MDLRLAGNLRGAPEFEGVCDFDRDANGPASMVCQFLGATVWGLLQSERNAFARIDRADASERLARNLHWAARRVYELDWQLEGLRRYTTSTAATTSIPCIQIWQACGLLKVSHRVVP